MINVFGPHRLIARGQGVAWRWPLAVAISTLAVAFGSGESALFSRAQAHPPPILSGAQEQAHGEEIKAWREAFAKTAKAKDAKRLKELYTPSFVHTDTRGRLSGSTVRIGQILAGAVVTELAAAEDLVVRVPGGWTAIATGRSRLTVTAGKSPVIMAWTAVYVRAGQGWQLASLHEHAVPRTPGR